MLGVMAQHRAAVGNIQDSDVIPADLLTACRQAWDDVLNLGEVHGYRNAQATVLAPTGTISFMMDCDTTGVEPDFSLVKSKKLVGGGEITIVNKSVQMALEKLGYTPAEGEEIVAFVDERNTVVGAPYVKAEHYPVFDCAVGDRAIHYTGHTKMMGAVQPFISGAISKTVNLPETATVDEVAKLFVDSWKLGVKAIAIYRDNCKVAQPLSGKKDGGAATLLDAATAAPPLPASRRRRLPDDRSRSAASSASATTRATSTSVCTRTGRPGDIFVDIAKEGTTLAGLMNSIMISVSLGLQYGVPLEVYVSKFAHMRFEPSGMTNDPDIRAAKSIVDYIFRWMGKKFLTVDQQEEIGILSAEVRARLAEGYRNGGDAPAVDQGAGRRWPRPGRPRSSTRSRTPRSAPGAAGGWCGPGPATRVGTAARTPAAREDSSRDASRPPSPAMVASPVSRSRVALSGGAYAVSTALPRNSVGPAQLKANAVNSAKVQNRSLRAGSRFRDRADPGEGAAGSLRVRPEPHGPACHPSSRTISSTAQLAAQADCLRGLTRDAGDLIPSLLDRRGAVDPEHLALGVLQREARDHARLGRAGHRARDHRVEGHAELRLLLSHLLRPAREPEPAQRMIGTAGRDCVRLPAALLD